MADGTKISWAEATVNAINGCSLASPGCTNCYAMRQAHRFEIRRDLVQPSKAGNVWTGEVRLEPSQLEKPLRWKKPRWIFWNAHGDTYHPSVPDEWIDRIMAVCALTPHHTHMILTKRSDRMRRYNNDPKTPQRIGEAIVGGLVPYVRGIVDPPLDWNDAMAPARLAQWPLPNVLLGVSVEDQQRAEERLPDLIATTAAARFISAEPLLEEIDIERWLIPQSKQSESPIDWVIVGGESGSGARPMDSAAARTLRDQCSAAGVAFHLKQWGEWLPVDSGHPGLEGPGFGQFDHARINDPGNVTHLKVGKHQAGHMLDGREHLEMPTIHATQGKAP